MTDPVQGFVVPGTLTVTVTDPNVGDDLYLRWIAEYPPVGPNSHLLRDDTTIPKSANGKPLFEMRSFPNLSCANLATNVAAHPVTALITDRKFPDPATLSTREQLLTSIAEGAGKVEAHWVINVLCQ